MRSHALKCIFFLCMIIASVFSGLYVDSRAFIVTFFCSIWFVQYLVKWLTGEQPKKDETFGETFKKFYGGPKDGTDRPSKEG